MKLEQIPKDETVYAWCGENWTKLQEWQHVLPLEMICALKEAYDKWIVALMQVEQLNNSINYALYDALYDVVL